MIMNYKSVIWSILFMVLIPKNFAEPDEDVYYVAEFTDQIKDCDGFENDVFKCNELSVGFVEGEAEGEAGLGLSGKLDVLAEIKDDYSICLKIWKETDLAKEFMYTVAGNICGSLKKQDTPWWPLVKSMNTTECPIDRAAYPVDNMVLSLDFAKDILRHEFVGDYEIEISIIDDLEQPMSCHVIAVGISEKSKN